MFLRCRKCSFLQIKEDSTLNISYSDYGAYWSTLPESLIKRRLKRSFPKRIFFFFFSRYFTKHNSFIADYGGGAGFLVKSLLTNGFLNSYLVEPSSLLREFAMSRLSISKSNIYPSLDAMPISTFNCIFMMDVLEHFLPSHLDHDFNKLVSKIRPGGLVVGKVPNLNSLNIRLHGDSDPSIAPPHHSLYFNNVSLQYFLKKYNLKPIFVFSYGLSTNSFFRKSKFTPSWIERPTGAISCIISVIIKLIFNICGLLLLPFNSGYNLFFIAKKIPS